MKVLEMIAHLQDEKQQIDFLIVYSEMSEELNGLTDLQKFKIIAKTIEVSHKSVIESHNKVNRVPKEVYMASILQGNMQPITFIKKWLDGSLEEQYLENLPKNHFIDTFLS